MDTKLEAERKIDEIMKDHPQYQVFGLADDHSAQSLRVLGVDARMHAVLRTNVSVDRWLARNEGVLKGD
ncbi:hypothetical protein BDR06DRAFT_1010913 [Suillus hirtellus]|nr:hypothetical protein BDR06DRAFT_1010913 [Suillus hirtellus]